LAVPADFFASIEDPETGGDAHPTKRGIEGYRRLAVPADFFASIEDPETGGDAHPAKRSFQPASTTSVPRTCDPESPYRSFFRLSGGGVDETSPESERL
jgi:hypothetical protein